jgi:proteic killer suppression protein
MIKTFADKETRAFFEGERVRAFEEFSDQARRRLDAVAVAETLRELQARPGNRFKALGGDRMGQYAVRINDQWRICFRWELSPSITEQTDVVNTTDPLDLPGHAGDVQITDYH